MNNRQEKILEYINQNTYVSFANLCKEFHVSNATMRRDLVSLDEKGCIERIHGGAKSLHYNENHNPNISQRLVQYPQEKESIAQYAFSLIQDGNTVLLDASTSCLQVAKLLKNNNFKGTVITNYFEIIQQLIDIESINLIFIGGNVRKDFNSTSGAIADTMIKTFRADIAFVGCDSVDPIRGLANNRLDVISMKQIIIQNSKKVYGLADHTKFETNAVIQIAPLEDLDGVITDSLSKELFKEFKEQQSKIIICRR